jgi:hypothetical protein
MMISFAPAIIEFACIILAVIVAEVCFYVWIDRRQRRRH